mmetsp:Transcript_8693/g.21822  ORF Transcript_8693/g.21822 Transcript_8693/m.21822 type:complete len:600 (+) Transcript_8693:95-1894(+)|eukprot:CAMPEP_0113442932 /NCGR_PEP_ID=MMETSP0014_2-20120614/1873_1 /TAXON_ID=2857 /ORGANISM="Nitzschia sp." /LENGTH=599 /DNA_ID=CAMNT_0000333863 /DNA_START=2191 /DNA_END=3993 /DNA_ORIENTATION=- /assembly_acc=CAM_ASM_000159
MSWKSHRLILSWTLLWTASKLAWFHPESFQVPNGLALAPTFEPGSQSQPQFVYYDRTKTYFGECRRRFIGNFTWGKAVAPLVDKLEAKDIIREWSPSVQVVRTITHLSKKSKVFEGVDNTLSFLQSLPQPYIIKPTHTSGSVAIVQNDTYHCFKACTSPQKKYSLDKDAASSAARQATMDLQKDYSLHAHETQYHTVPRRIIVEEALDMTKFSDVTYWYIANGKPIFVSLGCEGEHKRRAFFSTRFERLPMKHVRAGCEKPVEKPATWNQMHQIAKEIGAHLKGYVVRLDLYASDSKVYFSELTFTSNACGGQFRPLVADGLLHAILKEQIPASSVTAEVVERTIRDDSWVRVTLRDGWKLEAAVAYPSPADMCHGASSQPCLEYSHKLESSPLRCVIGTEDGKVTGAVGSSRKSAFRVALDKVDYKLVIALVLVQAVLYLQGAGGKPGNRWARNGIFLLALTVFLYFTTDNDGLFGDGHSLRSTAEESFRAFTMVHPMSSHLVIFSHVSTYWFKVASFRSKTLRGMLFWQILYEVVTCICNEYAHHREEQTTVRCLRMTFIGQMKRYVVEDVIRVYILPPFFVYGYMVPNAIFHFFSS